MINRRSSVAGILATLGHACHACAQESRFAGCTLMASTETSIAKGISKISRTSGNSDFDYALAQTLGMLSDTFGVTPGFGYYDDVPENACATPARLLGRSDGTVLIGLNLLKKLHASFESPSVAIATICAHEFGHIVQFKFNLLPMISSGQLTVKRSELQADYLAGYFTGLRKQRRPSYPAASAALTQHNVGDNVFYNRNHHGTPQERGEAVVRGFLAASRDGRGLKDAIEDSISYVMFL